MAAPSWLPPAALVATAWESRVGSGAEQQASRENGKVSGKAHWLEEARELLRLKLVAASKAGRSYMGGRCQRRHSLSNLLCLCLRRLGPAFPVRSVLRLQPTACPQQSNALPHQVRATFKSCTYTLPIFPRNPPRLQLRSNIPSNNGVSRVTELNLCTALCCAAHLLQQHNKSATRRSAFVQLRRVNDRLAW